MIVQKYGFADLVIEVRVPVPMMSRADADAFLLKEDRPADIIVEACQEPGEIDLYAPIRTEREGNTLRAYMDVSLLPGISVFSLLCGVNAAWLLPAGGRFMLHASYIIHEGQAILFAAPSETGKTTQAKFWQEERGAKLINEDRVIISRRGDTFYAHGAWATGTARRTANESAPIRAVVLLGQGEENRVSEPSAAEKLRRLIPLCTFDERNMMEHIHIIDAVSAFIEGARIVDFRCINHKSAVAELEGAI